MLHPLFLPAGGLEVAIIFGLILFLFGASKLPELANALGRSFVEFKRERHRSSSESSEES